MIFLNLGFKKSGGVNNNTKEKNSLERHSQIRNFDKDKH